VAARSAVMPPPGCSGLRKATVSSWIRAHQDVAAGRPSLDGRPSSPGDRQGSGETGSSSINRIGTSCPRSALPNLALGAQGSGETGSSSINRIGTSCPRSALPNLALGAQGARLAPGATRLRPCGRRLGAPSSGGPRLSVQPASTAGELLPVGSPAPIYRLESEAQTGGQPRDRPPPAGGDLRKSTGEQHNGDGQEQPRNPEEPLHGRSLPRQAL